MPARPAKNRPSRRSLAFEVAGERLSLRACGALWWEEQGVLVVSDLHLEKGSAYAVRGQMLPPYDTGATLGRIGDLLAELQPEIVVSLGDSFHDRHARLRMSMDDVRLIRSMTACCDWIWIEGNHDPKPPADLGGRSANELRIGALVFHHEPTPGPARGEIAGHLPPCARIDGRGGSVRARCFASDGQRLIMPAYGALTGGLNILDPAFAPLFPDGVIAGVIGRDSVYVATGDRLRPDAARATA